MGVDGGKGQQIARISQDILMPWRKMVSFLNLHSLLGSPSQCRNIAVSQLQDFFCDDVMGSFS